MFKNCSKLIFDSHAALLKILKKIESPTMFKLVPTPVLECKKFNFLFI